MDRTLSSLCVCLVPNMLTKSEIVSEVYANDEEIEKKKAEFLIYVCRQP